MRFSGIYVIKTNEGFVRWNHSSPPITSILISYCNIGIVLLARKKISFPLYFPYFDFSCVTCFFYIFCNFCISCTKLSFSLLKSVRCWLKCQNILLGLHCYCIVYTAQFTLHTANHPTHCILLSAHSIVHTA